MALFKNKIRMVLLEVRGQTLVEYVFLVALIAMVIYGTLTIFGSLLADSYHFMANNLMN